jgi:hypothetical protein
VDVSREILSCYILAAKMLLCFVENYSFCIEMNIRITKWVSHLLKSLP